MTSEDKTEKDVTVDETAEPARPELVPVEEEPSVSEPLKLIRIASMVQTMLHEVRNSGLDDGGRQLLLAVHGRTISELKEIMSEDLQAELDSVILPLESSASEAEVRIAQAQLAGWLEGLFHGIRASLWGQTIAVRREVGRNVEALESLEHPKEQASPGMYL